MDAKTIGNLYEKFEVQERVGAYDKTYKFIPSENIINRMIKVFNGKWSTEILQNEIIGNQVLVRVKVCAVDPVDGQLHCHEGFASHDINKYTKGKKVGEIVNIGNDFKSATSKAIRTACTRFGVGLYLEESDGDDYQDNSGYNKQDRSNYNRQSNYNENSYNNSYDKNYNNYNYNNYDGNYGNKNYANGTPKQVTPPLKNQQGLPGGFSSNVPKQATNVESTPEFNYNDSFNNSNNTMDETMITDIQLAAVSSLMSQHNLTLDKLLNDVFNNPNKVSKIEDLNYKDAREVIKYGNKLNRS